VGLVVEMVVVVVIHRPFGPHVAVQGPSLSIVILLSTLQAEARSSGIGVPSWHWLVVIAELEPKKHKKTLISRKKREKNMKKKITWPGPNDIVWARCGSFAAKAREGCVMVVISPFLLVVVVIVVVVPFGR
jgi:hypothetical protein